MLIITEFFKVHQPTIVLINALVYFALGLSISLRERRSSVLRLAGELWLLTSFAFCRSGSLWIATLTELEPLSPEWQSSFDIALVCLYLLSTIFLLYFGTRVAGVANKKLIWLQWLPPALLVLMLAVFIALRDMPGISGEGLLSLVSLLARYAFHVPGLALSGVSFVLYSKEFRDSRFHRISHYCLAAGGVFIYKALISSVILSKAPAFLLPVLTTRIFTEFLDPLVQISRTATTLIIACLVLGVLEVFKVEQNRRLEQETRQRFEAQQEALEAQRAAHEQMERWSRRLEDVVNVTASAISQPLEVKDMLATVLGKILELTGFEAGCVFLSKSSSSQSVLTAQVGISESALQTWRETEIGERVLHDIMASGELAILEDLPLHSTEAGALCMEQGIKILVSVPVKYREQVSGSMFLFGCHPHTVELYEQGVLAAIGQQVGVAIENARLYDELQRVAVLQERERLGRELHDGLAQVLGYLRLKAEDAESLLAGGHLGQAKRVLQGVQKVARDAYRDVRESILGLRTTLSPDTGLVATLTEYAHTLSQQSGLDVRVSVPDGTRIDFDPRVEIQLLRIVQESLTNIRKHAQARSAVIRFKLADEHMLVTVKDDGQGFDLAAVGEDGQQHFGLKTMRERAESVGAHIEISSRAGQGTNIAVWIPIQLRRKEQDE